MNDVPENTNLPGRVANVTRVNRSVADPYASDAPGVTIPEALALPAAGAVGTGVGGVTRAIVAGSAVIIRVAGSDRAADDRAADQTGRDTRAPAPTAAPCQGRRRRRNNQRGDGSRRHQCLSHAVPFLNEANTSGRVPYEDQSSTLRLNGR